MDIKQAYVSSALSYFKPGLFEKWGFAEYHDPSQPAFFLGLYNNKDITTFINHKGRKILYFGGADFQQKQINIVKNTKNTKCVGYGGDWLKNACIKYGLPFDDTRVLIRGFDDFTPTKLGDKIYVYKGINGGRESHYKWGNVIKPVMDIIGEDRFIYTDHKSIIDLRDNYYEKALIYLKPNESAGSTAMYELGYMGRRTITNGHTDFPNTISYNSINDIINVIKNEEERIGTIQKSVYESLKNFAENDGSWLNLDNYDW